MSNTHFDHFKDHHDLRERDHGIAGGDHDDDYDSLKTSSQAPSYARRLQTETMTH